MAASSVGAVQFPFFPDGGAVRDLHLHLHQDAIPCHSRAKDRVITRSLPEECKSFRSFDIEKECKYEYPCGFVVSSGRLLE
ncbi:hypothetical protein ZIOFF_016544 [Zingiber officinale]|uniref:Uncharacterized protein n=1 Tax=Zingiber officinale TaxID=94328 RepID=A0A8J5HSW7_ZINOF|nr:hypothetical protein ZIOFF_016544 [Zingiber officinale]